MIASAPIGPPPYRCELCPALLPNKFTMQAWEWDWFTGYLQTTVYFCPLHKDSDERHRLFALSQQQPEVAESMCRCCGRMVKAEKSTSRE